MCIRDSANTTFLSQHFPAGIAGQLPFLQAMEPGRREFAKRAKDLQALVERDVVASLSRSTADSFVFGPAAAVSSCGRSRPPSRTRSCTGSAAGS